MEHMVQSIAIRGKFICGQEPINGIRVKLFENNLNSQSIIIDEHMLAINSDNILNETCTDQNGQFFINGTTVKFGLRKIHFLVPYHFINYGIHAEKVLDLGIFNLEAILPVSMH
uniref:YopX domain-containing protein n=1 Tax=Loa loa TaxID=7209 RepID=A0A1I7VI63_LOALO